MTEENPSQSYLNVHRFHLAWPEIEEKFDGYKNYSNSIQFVLYLRAYSAAQNHII
jgi:hypothetical protein